MVSPQRPPERFPRPKAKTPAERAEEYTAEQRRLKREAAERREQSAATASKSPATPRSGSSSRPTKRRAGA